MYLHNERAVNSHTFCIKNSTFFIVIRPILHKLNRVKHKLIGFSVAPASPLKKVISHVQFLQQEECMIVNNGHSDVIYGVNWSQRHEDYLTIWKAGQLTPFPSLLLGYWPSLKEFLGPSQDTCYCLKVSRRQSDNKLFFFFFFAQRK